MQRTQITKALLRERSTCPTTDGKDLERWERAKQVYHKNLTKRVRITGKEPNPMPHAHTPGPWHRQGGIIQSASGKMIADARLMSKETAETWGLSQLDQVGEFDANARLIAASPEMLEALGEAQQALDILSMDVEEEFPRRAEATANLAMQLRSIITRATGREGRG